MYKVDFIIAAIAAHYTAATWLSLSLNFCVLSLMFYVDVIVLQSCKVKTPET